LFHVKHLLIASALILSACATSTAPEPDHKSISVSDSFVATEARLRAAIGARDLTLFSVIDHGTGATSVGRDIGQSKLFVFGNPEGGTPLLQASPEMGLDLPLKMLIFTDRSGKTRISYTDIKSLAARHDIEDQDERLKAIARMLRDVAKEAKG